MEASHRWTRGDFFFSLQRVTFHWAENGSKWQAAEFEWRQIQLHVAASVFKKHPVFKKRPWDVENPSRIFAKLKYGSVWCIRSLGSYHFVRFAPLWRVYRDCNFDCFEQNVARICRNLGFQIQMEAKTSLVSYLLLIENKKKSITSAVIKPD